MCRTAPFAEGRDLFFILKGHCVPKFENFWSEGSTVSDVYSEVEQARGPNPLKLKKTETD
jgi:hypothetical protein